jgi:hypothetical protein
MSTYSTSPLYNYINIQLTVNQNTGRFYFPDYPQLRDAKIQAISYYAVWSGMSKDINNVNLLGNGDIVNAYLTLYSGNKEAIQNLPLIKLVNVTAQQSGNNDGLFTIDNLMVDFSKSYVEFANGYTPVTTLPYSFEFGIYYTK